MDKLKSAEEKSLASTLSRRFYEFRREYIEIRNILFKEVGAK